MNMIEKCFLVQKMEEYRNSMLHQFLNNLCPHTFLESKKKGWCPSLVGGLVIGTMLE